MTVTMSDLSYTEQMQVHEIARQINTIGVGTIDIKKGSHTRGQRHRFREPLARLVGWPIEIGIDTDWDTGKRFIWFARKEQDNAVDPETQAARERLGFGQ